MDISPLSTIGALCLAGAVAGTDTRKLFNQLLVWGLSMCIVGALFCWTCSAEVSGAPWMTIIGIVRDVKTTGLEAESAPQIYR